MTLFPAETPPCIETLRAALAAYESGPADAAVWIELTDARRAFAAELAALSPSQKSGEAVNRAQELLQALGASGVYDREATTEDMALARNYARGKWPGLLAAMALVPAWQWREAPAIDKVPAWLWPDYVAYVFVKPQGFTTCGQTEAYAAQYLRRLEELARLIKANPASSTVVAAASVYLRNGNCIGLYFTPDTLRRHYELRGQIISLAAGVRRAEPAFPTPRMGRKLRVGFLNLHFGPQTETYTTLPTFEQLDPERFEVFLFACFPKGDTAVGNYASTRAAHTYLLSGDPEEQLRTLRGAALDVLVFGSNLTVVCNQVTTLAAHRIAPLQVVNNSSCTTTGLPEMDLYVSGTATETSDSTAHFTERLGLLPGPAHAFNYDADRQDPTTTWTRASLGVPEDATVFVSAANYFKIIPEMRLTWAHMLAAIPGSYLLLHPFNPNWSSTYPIERFKAEFESSLTQYGVDHSRLLISTVRFPSRSDVKALLSVGDIYLDTFPFGGVNSLIDPLELGMPIVAWEGETMRSRMGAALLRQLKLTELIATDELGYCEIALRLAADKSYRRKIGTAIQAAMESAPIFMDTLAASDAFGRLLETAYDELVEKGGEAFRREKTPVLTPGDVPLDAISRQMHARGLVASGRFARAADYLMAAVNTAPNDALIWFELAVALRQKGDTANALQALETSLRLDPRNVDGWRIMAEVAERLGAQDIATEARSVVEQLAPTAAADDLVPAGLSLDK